MGATRRTWSSLLWTRGTPPYLLFLLLLLLLLLFLLLFLLLLLLFILLLLLLLLMQCSVSLFCVEWGTEWEKGDPGYLNTRDMKTLIRKGRNFPEKESLSMWMGEGGQTRNDR